MNHTKNTNRITMYAACTLAALALSVQAHAATHDLSYNHVGISHVKYNPDRGLLGPDGWQLDARYMLTEQFSVAAYYRKLDDSIMIRLPIGDSQFTMPAEINITEAGLQLGYRYAIGNTTDLNGYLNYSRNKEDFLNMHVQLADADNDTTGLRHKESYDRYGVAAGISHLFANRFQLSVIAGYEYDQRWRGRDEKRGRTYATLALDTYITKNILITAHYTENSEHNAFSVGVRYRF